MYYTPTPRTDGFGAQFQNIIFDIVYTYTETDHTYLFPNISSFEHNYSNEPDFTNRLVRYMNLKEHFSLKGGVGGGGGGIGSVMTDFLFQPTVNTYSLCNYAYFEENISRLLVSPPMKLIKSLFYADKNTCFDTAYYNVAVHVRRFNAHDTRVDGVDTPDVYYLNMMKYIRANHSSDKKPLRFHIYSQCGDDKSRNECKEKYTAGMDDGEGEGEGANVVFHLNDDVLLTFHGMVFADALVCSRSSYSYCAALLSNGVIYYKPFWHKPADFWFNGDECVASLQK